MTAFSEFLCEIPVSDQDEVINTLRRYLRDNESLYVKFQFDEGTLIVFSHACYRTVTGQPLKECSNYNAYGPITTIVYRVSSKGGEESRTLLYDKDHFPGKYYGITRSGDIAYSWNRFEGGLIHVCHYNGDSKHGVENKYYILPAQEPLIKRYWLYGNKVRYGEYMQYYGEVLALVSEVLLKDIASIVADYAVPK